MITIFVTTAHKKGTRWGKIRFWVFSIFSVVIYQESLCENFVAISKVLFEIWPFYISLITNLAFVFHWFFILFLGLNNIAYCTLRSTTFLLFDLGHWYLACTVYISSVSGPYRPITPYVKPFFTPQLCSQPWLITPFHRVSRLYEFLSYCLRVFHVFTFI
jgi:hypothetical protein